MVLALKAPTALKAPLRDLERAGFRAMAAEPRKGAHWKVWFEGISQPVLMSGNGSCPRATKNMVAHLRRLSR